MRVVFFIAPLMALSIASMGQTFSDQVIHDINERNIYLTSQYPMGQITWRVLRQTHYTEQTIERLVKNNTDGMKSNSSTDKIAAREVELRKMYRKSNSTESIATGHALMNRDMFLENFSYLEPEKWTLKYLWKNGKCLTLMGGGKFTMMGEINSHHFSAMDSMSPLRMINQKYRRATDGSELHHSEQETQSEIVLEARKEGGSTPSAVLRFDVNNSLVNEITMYQASGKIDERTVIEWNDYDGVWIPSSIISTTYDLDEAPMETKTYDQIVYEPIRVEEDNLKMSFPPGTYVKDMTVSPPYSYKVETAVEALGAKNLIDQIKLVQAGELPEPALESIQLSLDSSEEPVPEPVWPDLGTPLATASNEETGSTQKDERSNLPLTLILALLAGAVFLSAAVVFRRQGGQ